MKDQQNYLVYEFNKTNEIGLYINNKPMYEKNSIKKYQDLIDDSWKKRLEVRKNDFNGEGLTIYQKIAPKLTDQPNFKIRRNDFKTYVGTIEQFKIHGSNHVKIHSEVGCIGAIITKDNKIIYDLQENGLRFPGGFIGGDKDSNVNGILKIINNKCFDEVILDTIVKELKEEILGNIDKYITNKKILGLICSVEKWPNEEKIISGKSFVVLVNINLTFEELKFKREVILDKMHNQLISDQLISQVPADHHEIQNMQSADIKEILNQNNPKFLKDMSFQNEHQKGYELVKKELSQGKANQIFL